MLILKPVAGLAVLAAVGCSPGAGDKTDQDILRYIRGSDRNGDDALSFDEFRQSIPPALKGNPGFLEKAFAGYDYDRDGIISVEDMRKVRAVAPQVTR